MVRLEVYDGSHRRALDIASDQVQIGRDTDCDVVLPGDPTVSRKHAVLDHVDGRWTVRDADSRNGTFVNGERIACAVGLSASDRVLIGSYVLVLHSGSEIATETVGAEETPSRIAVATGLSRREIEILRLVCAGRSDQQIADALVISVKTVHTHLDRIRDKTGCRRRPALVRYGIDHGVC